MKNRKNEKRKKNERKEKQIKKRITNETKTHIRKT